jgi:hypothetical protein
LCGGGLYRRGEFGGDVVATRSTASGRRNDDEGDDGDDAPDQSAM